ncbi:hypothetical protein OQX63_05800 [Pedobacter sp. PF22-3]|uniref:hypothetical protein n=1 Tax=Pedobacter sp. PF22-3 TaxID=2994467 RepID=UPI0022481C53|nr:hypothetical protein [Pedobacter sp. PF22-3]MCX2492976.1 hypothetical protein [Pedobacter sp. PF22-3]
MDEFENFDDTDHQPEILEFIREYDKVSLLKALAALQLSPLNQGKEVRMEMMINDVLLYGQNNNLPVPYQVLVDFFGKHYRMGYMEDPLIAHFTENVVFFGGNYTIYPGNFSDISDKLKAILGSIFMVDNALSYEFKTKADYLAMLLLSCSELLAQKAGTGRYIVEESEEEPIFIPEQEVFNQLMTAVVIGNATFSKLSKAYQIPEDLMKDFLINDTPISEDYDPEDSVFLTQPFFEIEDGIICLTPSIIGFALYTRIRSLADETNEKETLRDAFHQWQSTRILGFAKRSRWAMVGVELPENPAGQRMIEQVFQIDSNKLVYICLLKKMSSDPEEIKSGTVYDRMENVVDHLNKLNNGNTKVLSVLVGGAFDDQLMLMWRKPKEGNHNLVFSFSDLEIVMQSEDIEPLMLWKFAKAHNLAATRTEHKFMADTIDMFAYYKNNHGSLLPSDEAPGFMIFSGTATEYVRDLVSFRDEHGARRLVDGKLADITVKRVRTFAPLYKEERQSRYNSMLVESYRFPLWVTNSQAKNKEDSIKISIYIEAVAFWMFRLSAEVSAYLNQLGKSPVEIQLELDSSLLKKTEPYEYLNLKPFTGDLDLIVEQRQITVTIPFAIVSLLSDEENGGEQLLMKTILLGFNVVLRKSGYEPIAEEHIIQVINRVLNPKEAKMILFSDSSSNPLLDNRNLPPPRYLMDTEQELISDHLVEMLNPATPIPKEITDIKEKHKLCMELVSTLLEKVENKLKRFDTPKLLEYLVTLNERLIFQSQYNSLLLPSKIACYSDFQSEVTNLKKQDGKLAPTSLAVRGVIEFIIASPSFDGEPVNMDDIDEIIALMDEAIRWATVADSITLLGNDPEIGLLNSGRIGILDNFANDIFAPFNNSRAEAEVYYSMNPGQKDDQFDEGKVFVNNDVTDAAFLEEWGVSFTTITALFGSLQMFGLEQGNSFMTMKEDEFLTEIPKKFKKAVSENELMVAINLFTLDPRKAVKKAPNGFIAKDILPWRVNRALSFVRRPIIRITYPGDKQPTYHWGFRHLMSSYMSLTGLVSSNKLKVTEDGPIATKVMSIFVKYRGKQYRNEVYDWLKQNTSLRLIEYEVTIEEKGHLIADKNYGDVDVMAIDDKSKIIYCIECKNTASARAIHEMKTELDSYIGQDEKGGHILKHLNRHKWLNEHIDQLEKFVDDPKGYKIVSFVLSSNVIPAVYLAKNKAALPIVSFRDMVINGFESISKML